MRHAISVLRRAQIKPRIESGACDWWCIVEGCRLVKSGISHQFADVKLGEWRGSLYHGRRRRARILHKARAGEIEARARCSPATQGRRIAACCSTARRPRSSAIQKQARQNQCSSLGVLEISYVWRRNLLPPRPSRAAALLGARASAQSKRVFYLA